jgi:hypothetical protein
MTLTYDATTTPVTVTNVTCMTARPSSNEIVCALVNGSSYFIRRYAAASGHAQQGSDFALPTGGTPVVANGGIAMITNDKVLVLSGSNNNGYIVDLSTNTGAAVASSTDRTGYSTFRPQQVAGQPSAGIAIGISLNVFKLCRVTSVGAATNINPTGSGWFTNEFFTCIIPKGTTRFLLGTTHGRIIEIDTDGVIIKQYALPERRRTLEHTANTVRQITQLAYYSDYVVAVTHLGELYLFDHDLGVVLQQQSNLCVSSNNGSMFWLSEANGPSVYTAYGANPVIQTNIADVDMCLTPMKFADIACISGAIRPTAINYCNGYIAVSRDNNNIYWFTTGSPRSVTLEPVTITDGASGVDGELIVVDDTVSPPQVMFATTVSENGRDVPVTSGKSSVLMVSTYGRGVHRNFDIRREAT